MSQHPNAGLSCGRDPWGRPDKVGPTRIAWAWWERSSERRLPALGFDPSDAIVVAQIDSACSFSGRAFRSSVSVEARPDLWSRAAGVAQRST